MHTHSEPLVVLVSPVPGDDQNLMQMSVPSRDWRSIYGALSGMEYIEDSISRDLMVKPSALKWSLYANLPDPAKRLFKAAQGAHEVQAEESAFDKGVANAISAEAAWKGEAPPWDELDPGVADTVCHLWQTGFVPISSSDGVVAAAENPDADDVKPCRRITLRSTKAEMLDEADRAWAVLTECRPWERWTFEARWDGKDALIHLTEQLDLAPHVSESIEDVTHWLTTQIQGTRRSILGMDEMISMLAMDHSVTNRERHKAEKDREHLKGRYAGYRETLAMIIRGKGQDNG